MSLDNYSKNREESSSNPKFPYIQYVYVSTTNHQGGDPELLLIQNAHNNVNLVDRLRFIMTIMTKIDIDISLASDDVWSKIKPCFQKVMKQKNMSDESLRKNLIDLISHPEIDLANLDSLWKEGLMAYLNILIDMIKMKDKGKEPHERSIRTIEGTDPNWWNMDSGLKIFEHIKPFLKREEQRQYYGKTYEVFVLGHKNSYAYKNDNCQTTEYWGMVLHYPEELPYAPEDEGISWEALGDSCKNILKSLPLLSSEKQEQIIMAIAKNLENPKYQSHVGGIVAGALHSMPADLQDRCRNAFGKYLNL